MVPSGYKATKLYSVIPSDGTGDFTHARTTLASRINSAGLIQNMGIDVPRLDCSDGVCPVLLLEDSSTNIAYWSEDFTLWTLVASTMDGSGFISPSTDSLNNADKWMEDAGTVSPSGVSSNSTLVATNDYCISYYVKYNGRQYYRIRFEAAGFGTNEYASFDIQNGVIDAATGGIKDFNIEPAANGYFRVWAVCEAVGTSGRDRIYMDDSPGTGIPSYTGDGVSGVFLFGRQFEKGSVPSSYTKTEGSTVTKSADKCFDAIYNGDSDSGVLFVEMAALENDFTNRYITIYKDVDNYIRLYYRSSASNQIYSIAKIGGIASSAVASTGVVDITEYHKIAIRWNSATELSLWVNGLPIHTIANIPVIPSILFTTVSFTKEDGTGNMFAKVKQLQTLTYLTDTEMAEITS